MQDGGRGVQKVQEAAVFVCGDGVVMIFACAILHREILRGTIRELVELNAAVRGGLTDTPEDAKTIVTATETEEIEGKTIISAYELDKIMNLI